MPFTTFIKRLIFYSPCFFSFFLPSHLIFMYSENTYNYFLNHLRASCLYDGLLLECLVFLMDQAVGINRCKLVDTEWINNKVLLYSTGNYIQYPVINQNGKEYEDIYIYMYN